ncbi:MAG: TIGR00296 family protein [Euryarchaeota archaeon]|nr:TIGR00296 family protein [Euryarchaeota archaeon]
MYTDEEGEAAVRLARGTIDAVVVGKMPAMPHLGGRFDAKSGAFVTIETYPALKLRGCIGYPEPIFALKEALARAAAGATEDPRFPRLAETELDKVVVDVSLLTPPELIRIDKLRNLPREVKVGRDGLIAERHGLRGLLLPQVATDYNLSPEEFLSETCMKAGLDADAWLVEGTRMFRFGAEVFCEKEPRGKVERKVLG